MDWFVIMDHRVLEQTPAKRVGPSGLFSRWQAIRHSLLMLACLMSFLALLLLTVVPSISGERVIGDYAEEINANLFGIGSSTKTTGDTTTEAEVKTYHWTDEMGNRSTFIAAAAVWLIGLLIGLHSGLLALHRSRSKNLGVWDAVRPQANRFGRIFSICLTSLGSIQWHRNMGRCTLTDDGSLDWINPTWSLYTATVLSVAISLLLIAGLLLELASED